MPRKMVDSVNPAAWPLRGWDLGAAYINGAVYGDNYRQVRARFPDAELVTVSTNADPTVVCDVADCEKGDYDPPLTAEWCANMIDADRRPSPYAGRSTWPYVVQELRLRHIPLTLVDWWATTLDGTVGPTIVCSDGQRYAAVAVQDHQWAGCDWSVVYDDQWPHRLSTVFPQENGVNRVRVVSDGQKEWLVSGDLGCKHWLDSEPLASDWAKALGQTVVPTDPKLIQGISREI